MRKLINILSIICLLFLFCSSKAKKQNSGYIVAFVKDIYVDEGNYKYNDVGDSTYTKGDGQRVENYVGVFSKKYDTVTIYKLKEDLNVKPEEFSFWSKKKSNLSITFYCSMADDIKVTFTNQNNIIVNDDTYQVNKEYYDFLKQKILIEKSVLDLTFFLKDGYGDYQQSLKPLNKNWRNQKENKKFKIIKAKIKNKNYQTDDQFYNYNFTYEYSKNGMLENILGENSFNKKFVEENNKYRVHSIERSINERALDNEYLYKNKKTFFDSIVGNRILYSNATAYYYREYQAELIIKNSTKKLSSLKEALDLLNCNLE